MQNIQDIDSAETQAEFADFLWDTGASLHAHSTKLFGTHPEHRDWLRAKIKELHFWLQATETNHPIHCMTLLLLSHAYFALFRLGWNNDNPNSHKPLRQAIETVDLLERTTRKRENTHLTDHLRFLRYLFSGRYGRLAVYSPRLYGHIDLSGYEDLMAADKQYLSHTEQPFTLADKSHDEIVLYNRIRAHLIYPQKKHVPVLAAPMSDWWANDVEDQYVQLLRAARMRSGDGCKLLWQWHLTDVLKQFLDAENEAVFRPVINRLAQLGCTYFGGKVPKSGISTKNEKLYWATTKYSIEYRGYRVFAAALATRRNWLDQIISSPELSRKQKLELLATIEPFCGLSRGAVKSCLHRVTEMKVPKVITDLLQADLDKMPTIEQRRKQRQKARRTA